MITLTPAAVKHLEALLAAKSASGENGLRLGVEKGGCAGMQYTMGFGLPEEGDLIVKQAGALVLINQDSLPYLDGCQIDYQDGLNDAGFKIMNPRASRSCGCGTSFEPLAK